MEPRSILKSKSMDQHGIRTKTVRFSTDHNDLDRANKKKKPRRGKKNKAKSSNLRILYANINGIRSKLESLQSAVDTHNSHIVAITETHSKPPKLDGYTQWLGKNRTGKGGGVALAVREDYANKIQPIDDLEDDNQEIMWARLDLNHNRKLSIGVYYGKQENEKKEIVEREYSQLTTQIIKLKQQGPVVLTGDFNAKIEINKGVTQQSTSRNGKLLNDLIAATDLVPISTKAESGTWTRVNRKNTEEKSVIDYILVRKEDEEFVTENVVDEVGLLRLKGANESDHNTLTMTLDIPLKKQTQTIKRWNLNNTEGWRKFNKAMNQAEIKTDDYSDFEEKLIKTLEKTVGSTQIRIGGKRKNKETEEIKQLREEKKELNKKLKKDIKENNENKLTTLDEYIKCQKKLREKIAENNRAMTKTLINQIIQEGGTKSKSFWNLKKKLEGKKGNCDYNTITEDGEELQDPETAKEYIANYYENLYQAREGRPEFEEWTKKIKEDVQTISNSDVMKTEPKEITKEEVVNVIKKLKNGKATGPDDIPNEVFKEAEEDLINIITEVMNNIAKTKEIPSQWQIGRLIRLYKGKGKRGKCTNERGITLSSNVGKMFERIINERALKEIIITENQAGGQKGRSTSDHIALLQEMINEARRNKKPVYIVFLDVTKAYDKAWSDAILHVMHKEGLKSPEWEIVKKLNENLSATITTKYGTTREIKIKDSIRQGGVLSVAQYALLMDEINKEITKENLGIYMPSLDEKIGCLLWMDDVILATTEPKEMQRMLDITDHTSGKYHVEFGKPKSNAMKIGGNSEKPEFRLGNMILEYTDKYKYLGKVQNNKNNLADHIKSLKGKVEAAYQTIMSVAGNTHFKEIEMETIWELIECTISAIITYGGDTWDANKGEMKKINSLMDNIIRRILKTPQGTPREALYIETGLLDPETISTKQRILLDQRLKTGNSERLSRLTQTSGKKSWKELTDKARARANISEEDLTGKPCTIKNKVRNKIRQYFKEKLITDSTDKSKVKFLTDNITEWKAGIRPQYMKHLSRNNVSIIFKARTRMLDVKNNFRNKYSDLLCRACGTEPETQDHVLEKCKSLHPDEQTQVKQSEIFNENPDKLNSTAKQISKTLDKLSELAQLPQNRAAAPL